MTRRVKKAGGRIIEVPITFVERVAGKSKMHLRIVVEARFSSLRGASRIEGSDCARSCPLVSSSS